MVNNKRVKTVAAACMMACVLLLSACGSKAGAPSASAGSSQAEGEAVTLSVVGSTSVEPLVQVLKDNYQQDVNANAAFDIQAPGSSGGIKAAIDGTADIGMSSRDLKDDEKSSLKETVLAMDGIAVIVNKNNTVDDLSSEEITKIFKGEITNWKDVGGADKEIILVSREAGSGTRDAFEEIMDLVKDKKSLVAEDKAIFTESTNSVMQNVQDKDNAIGYISLGSLKADVKPLKVDGVACNAENILDQSYVVARPFLLVTNGDPQGEVKAFLDYCLSEAGQKLVQDNKYIPVQ
nr:phosphate ABC transporter substrate-binding protein [Maliibacterium massiliense]